MNRILVIGTRVVIAVLLLFSLGVQVVLVPLAGRQVASTFPQAAGLVVPGIIWCVVAILCGQAILVITWRLVDLAASDGIFDTSAFGWVRAMIAVSGALTGLFAICWIGLDVLSVTPPAIMYALVGLCLVGLAFTLILTIMLRLLRRAAALSADLAQVI